MAFDLHQGSERAFIAPHEEGFFTLVNECDRYPVLAWLLAQWYDSPRISPEQANSIVHEFIALREALVASALSGEVRVIDRVLPFFSRAYVSGNEVRCVSD